MTKKSGKDSSHATSKYIVNKRRFETLNIAHEIDALTKAWHVSKIAFEDLHFKSSFSRHESNRLCKNNWNRLLFENKLKMLAKEHGIQVVEINPAYTSQVGNILYGNNTTPDMVAASIEIARRAYKKFQKGWFYPDFSRSLSLIDEQWKQTLLGNSVKSWSELFAFIKESEIKYRIPLDRCKPSRVLRLNSKKSFISLLEYDII